MPKISHKGAGSERGKCEYNAETLPAGAQTNASVKIVTFAFHSMGGLLKKDVHQQFWRIGIDTTISLQILSGRKRGLEVGNRLTSLDSEPLVIAGVTWLIYFPDWMVDGRVRHGKSPRRDFQSSPKMPRGPFARHRKWLPSPR